MNMSPLPPDDLTPDQRFEAAREELDRRLFWRRIAQYAAICLAIAAAASIMLAVVGAGQRRDARAAEAAIHVKHLEDLEHRVRNACGQQATVLAILLQRNRRGEDVTEEMKDALAYGSPAIWLCAGDWPELAELLAATPTELQAAFDRMLPQIDPERGPP